MNAPTPRPSRGCFVDRTREPSIASVRRALGKARAPWDELEEHLAKVHGLTGSLHFMYGERYGWAFRFERRGRLVAAMYPNRRYLTVQIILNRTQVSIASTTRLSPAVARVFESATDHPEGRWLFFRVSSIRTARELKPLFDLKLSP